MKTLVNYELTSALMAQLSGKEDTSELMAVVAMREDQAGASGPIRQSGAGFV